VQIVAALMMAFWGEVSLQNLGNLVGGGTILLGDCSVPLTVFATVGVINAINMIDGMDGLAGGLVFILLLCLSVLCFSHGLIANGQFLLVVTMAVSAFLLLNIRWPGRRQAKVFMGDAGSLFLGLVVAWFLIKLSQQSPPVISPVTALWLFAVPLMDTVGLILRRLAKGRSPFAAGREHLHHIFLAAGFTVGQTLTVILLISIILGGIGLVGAYIGISEPIMFWSFMALFTGYLIISVYAWQRVSQDQNNTTKVDCPVRPVEANKP
jgi:UDP-GlcNAc:undecaprenyl-phosphate GlcNAc-1-phosphate transferase